MKLKSKSFLRNFKVLLKLTGDAFSATALSERLVLEEDVGGDGIGEDLKSFKISVSDLILASFDFDRSLTDMLKALKSSFSSINKVCLKDQLFKVFKD